MKIRFLYFGKRWFAKKTLKQALFAQQNLPNIFTSIFF